MASTTGDSGEVEMSPRTTMTSAVTWPRGLRATTCKRQTLLFDASFFVVRRRTHLVEASIRGHGGVEDQGGLPFVGGGDLQPGVVHEDEIVLEPVDGGLGLGSHQATEGQRLALTQGNVLGLLPANARKYRLKTVQKWR